VNVRLGPGRIAIPDLVVSSPEIDIEELVIDAAAIRLVCEIGGIPWYLLVDPRARALQLYRLASGTYVEEATVKDGDVLRLTEPIAATIDPEKLFPPV
jgi:Uma2 family endonuclease